MRPFTRVLAIAALPMVPAFAGVVVVAGVGVDAGVVVVAGIGVEPGGVVVALGGVVVLVFTGTGV